MTYLEVMYHSTKHYEYTQDTVPAVLEQIATLNTDLIALQRWSRRSMATHLKIHSVISFLEHHCPKDRDGGTCRLLIEDYKHIASSLDIYSRRLEAMVPIVTSLIQIIDNYRSLIETANLSRLTHLALVFVPLTFVSGLFSMNETVKPGSKAFWIYGSYSVVYVSIPHRSSTQESHWVLCSRVLEIQEEVGELMEGNPEYIRHATGGLPSKKLQS